MTKFQTCKHINLDIPSIPVCMWGDSHIIPPQNSTTYFVEKSDCTKCKCYEPRPDGSPERKGQNDDR